jgi:Undecaprenyl-phosphate glucose phosphotransferase
MSAIVGTKTSTGETVGVFKVSAATLKTSLALADMVLVCFALFVAEFAYAGSILSRAAPWTELAALGVGIGAIFVMHQVWRGGYDLRSIRDPRRQIGLTLGSWLLVFFIVGWLAFLTKTIGGTSRVSIALFFVLGFGIVIAGRLGVQRLVRKALERQQLVTGSAFALIMGDDARCETVLNEMRTSGIRPVGFFQIPADSKDQSLARDMKRAIEKVRSSLAQRRCDAVHVYMPWSNMAALGELRRIVNHSAIPTILMADSVFDSIVAGRTYDNGQQRGFELQRPPLTLVERAIKRLFDILISSVLLLLLSPLLLFVALAVRLESKGPALFRQDRKGFAGRPFQIYKFRTMRVMENGADIRQAERNDPRITRFGAVLRKTSIDELPQLFNVLKGEMSLVGPRPHAVAHDNHFDKIIALYATRQHVKPGLTGLAQVSGFRGETKTVEAMAARVERDIWYVNNWSVWQDLRILAQTALMTVFDKNAY